jgi:hypothetical protein
MASSARKKASPLLGEAVKRVAALSRERQDAIATQILDTLDNEANPANARFHQLIEQKYTAGLSAAEAAELDRLEAMFQIEDERFYGPILKRIAGKSK